MGEKITIKTITEKGKFDVIEDNNGNTYTVWDDDLKAVLGANIGNTLDCEIKTSERNGTTYKNIRAIYGDDSTNAPSSNNGSKPQPVGLMQTAKDKSIVAQCIVKAVIAQPKGEYVDVGTAVRMYQEALNLI
ncbi:MAG: hypothetical protein H8D23_39905 [Candidatus Brocadiales bacterium]|nr:hypothetical protein [Candidatus Brocadiales bacterium]